MKKVAIVAVVVVVPVVAVAVAMVATVVVVVADVRPARRTSDRFPAGVQTVAKEHRVPGWLVRWQHHRRASQALFIWGTQIEWSIVCAVLLGVRAA